MILLTVPRMKGTAPWSFSPASLPLPINPTSTIMPNLFTTFHALDIRTFQAFLLLSGTLYSKHSISRPLSTHQASCPLTDNEVQDGYTKTLFNRFSSSRGRHCKANTKVLFNVGTHSIKASISRERRRNPRPGLRATPYIRTHSFIIRGFTGYLPALIKQADASIGPPATYNIV